MHYHHQQHPDRVHKNVSLSPIDLLFSIIASLSSNAKVDSESGSISLVILDLNPDVLADQLSTRTEVS